MSLDKAIEHGKEHRKQYRGSKAIDYTCRNHGTCPVCQSNRMREYVKAADRQKSELKDFIEELMQKVDK